MVNTMRAGKVLFHSILKGRQILGDFLLGPVGGTGAADMVPFFLISMNVDKMSGATAITL